MHKTKEQLLKAFFRVFETALNRYRYYYDKSGIVARQSAINARNMIFDCMELILACWPKCRKKFIDDYAEVLKSLLKSKVEVGL